MKNKESQSTWGGRFEASPSELMQLYSESVSFDKRLAPYDILCSKAHSAMLAKVGILTSQERDAIHEGLDQIASEIQEGRFDWSTELEDVHMNIEHVLTQRVPAAAKLHTGRSRNDQVATDVALFLKDSIKAIAESLRKAQKALVGLAEKNKDLLIPGYTHLQRAQPVPVAHHLLAYVEMFERDHGRLMDCLPRINRCPLGSGALAGSTLPLDREETARILGFVDKNGNPRVTQNSMDAIASRDGLLEFTGACAIIATHASRLAEDFILWSSSEFGFIRLPDQFTTGSSLMPQKKNPDAMELIRGKAARVHGNLMTLFGLVKGLPLTYNRDLQEDKPPLFDAAHQVLLTLGVIAEMAPDVLFVGDRCAVAVSDPLLLATDLADALVLEGVAFREAHHQVGALVKSAEQHGVKLSELSDSTARGIAPKLPENWQTIFSNRRSLSLRDTPGSPHPARVDAELKGWKGILG